MTHSQIYLSPPHISGREQAFIQEAFDTNWIAPVGPHITAFEQELCAYTGAKHAVALSSGTAALHLALILTGVKPHDEVLVSTLTFSASVNPIIYCGGRPVFIDSEEHSWNIDPELVTATIQNKVKAGQKPKAVIVVHLYGQSADLDPIVEICQQYDITLIEDAAEALGTFYKGRHTGTIGKTGFFSFNGNKIITTSGGGMLVSDDKTLIDKARKLSTQARDNAPHYQHSEIGYNYRLSNVLAGIGRGQLELIEDRVAARRRNFEYYQETLGSLPGITFMPEASYGRHTRWLTVIQVDPDKFGMDRDQIRLALEAAHIEARPVWKPMHCQPVFAQYEAIGGTVAEKLFANGLCLPSGSSLTTADLERITTVIRELSC